MSKKILALGLVSFLAVGLLFGNILYAEDSGSAVTSEDIQKMLDKLDNLEKENQALREELSSVKSQVNEIKETAKTAKDPLQKENQALKDEVNALKKDVTDMKTAASKQQAASSKPPILSSLPVELYGHVKLDAVWSDSQAGEIPQSAPYNEKTDNNEFNMYAKDARLGLNITGIELPNGGKVLGKLEGDFMGVLDDATTVSTFRIRQAYVDLKYPKWDFLAGQTWDFFSPLNPSTLNFVVLWRAGNMGDRRPQARLTNVFDKVLGGKVTTQVGIVDTKTDAQANSGHPVGAVYTSYEKGPVTVGMGAFYGRSDVSTTNSQNVKIWANTFTLKWTLSQMFSLMAEGYYGANLASFRAGSPTGVDHNKSVRARGGWTQLTFKPKKDSKFQFNVGAGIDDVYTDSTSTGSTAVWDYNYSYFTNVKYEIVKNLVWGLEYQYFKTEYANQDGGDANVVHSSLCYSF